MKSEQLIRCLLLNSIQMLHIHLEFSTPLSRATRMILSLTHYWALPRYTIYCVQHDVLLTPNQRYGSWCFYPQHLQYFPNKLLPCPVITSLVAVYLHSSPRNSGISLLFYSCQTLFPLFATITLTSVGFSSPNTYIGPSRLGMLVYLIVMFFISPLKLLKALRTNFLKNFTEHTANCQEFKQTIQNNQAFKQSVSDSSLHILPVFKGLQKKNGSLTDWFKASQFKLTVPKQMLYFTARFCSLMLAINTHTEHSKGRWASLTNQGCLC